MLDGNNRFEGYSLDLIDSIAKQLNFTYRFELVPDGKYGSYNKITKKWDGLVKYLLDRVSFRIWVSSDEQSFISSL
jgi:ionotropic glutamate receptor